MREGERIELWVEGRDENVNKMDVNSVNCRPGRRPVEKLSLVNVDQENVRMVDVDVFLDDVDQ